MLQIILVLTILGYSYYLYRSRSKDGDYIFGGVMISLFVIILLTVIGNTVFLKEQLEQIVQPKLFPYRIPNLFLDLSFWALE